jgi:acyl-CoA thioester hydrolase
MIPLEKIELLPLFHRETIPSTYIDLMGHMNVRWYMAIYNGAWRDFFASIGMTEEFFNRQQAGGFALKHFIRYYAEVCEGETVAVRTRIIGRSEKRIHFVHFMVNESTRKLASTLEALGSYADMRIRKTAPYPQEIAALIDEKTEEYSKLDWDPPLCGCIEP